MMQNVLHFQPCDDNSSFRAEQCEAYNTDDIKWTPFNDETPGKLKYE